MPHDAADPSQFDEVAVAERIAAIVRSKTQLQVYPHSTFDELGLDSLAMAEMVSEIEATFRVQTDDSILDVESLPELVKHVAQLLLDS